MSDQQQKTNAHDNDRLFENMDEQERLYAPEEVPGATQPPHEVDVGGTAASNTASTANNQATGPADGVLPVAGSTNPFPVPVHTSAVRGEEEPGDDAATDRRGE